MRVIILRGIPGAGKTTWAKANHPRAVVCSADRFFTDTETGAYHFDPTKIGAAHNWCFRAFLDCMEAGDRDVVVDNTNIGAIEIAPYMLAARAIAGVDPEIVTVLANEDAAARRNIHGVPPEVVAKMATYLDLEKLPPFWPTPTVVHS